MRRLHLGQRTSTTLTTTRCPTMKDLTTDNTYGGTHQQNNRWQPES